MIKEVVTYGNYQGVRHMIFPIFEWVEDENTGNITNLIRFIKTGLIESNNGDLEIISFTIEESNKSLQKLLKIIQDSFAESIIRID